MWIQLELHKQGQILIFYFEYNNLIFFYPRMPNFKIKISQKWKNVVNKVKLIPAYLTLEMVLSMLCRSQITLYTCKIRYSVPGKGVFKLCSRETTL